MTFRLGRHYATGEAGKEAAFLIEAGLETPSLCIKSIVKRGQRSHAGAVGEAIDYLAHFGIKTQAIFVRNAPKTLTSFSCGDLGTLIPWTCTS